MTILVYLMIKIVIAIIFFMVFLLSDYIIIISHYNIVVNTIYKMDIYLLLCILIRRPGRERMFF